MNIALVGPPNASEFSCGGATVMYSTKLLGVAVSYNSSLGRRFTVASRSEATLSFLGEFRAVAAVRAGAQEPAR